MRSAVLHLKSAKRLARPRALRDALGSPDDRLVFVLGSPRSGTTFLAGAIGFYGSLVNNNAYDQPGVEAGKKAASKLLELQKQVRAQLSHKGKIAEQIAGSVDGDPEQVFHLSHLASNDARINVGTGDEPADNRFSLRHSK